MCIYLYTYSMYVFIYTYINIYNYIFECLFFSLFFFRTQSMISLQRKQSSSQCWRVWKAWHWQLIADNIFEPSSSRPSRWMFCIFTFLEILLCNHTTMSKSVFLNPTSLCSRWFFSAPTKYNSCSGSVWRFLAICATIVWRFRQTDPRTVYIACRSHLYFEGRTYSISTIFGLF